MALAEIITIGDELLIGQVVDTNSAWIGQKLSEINIAVKQITSVSDNSSHLISALDEARTRADIIIITGGLGPTKDDITKYTLCKYFKSNLRFDEDAFLNVERIFKARGKEVSDVNRRQAEVPEKCEVIQNSMGTAPGMWFEINGSAEVVVSGDGYAVADNNDLLHVNSIVVSIPGVPYEMKAMMERDILPKLQKRFVKNAILHKTVLTQGIGESTLSDMIEQWEVNLPKNIKLAYLPSPGLVRLRLTGTGTNREVLSGLMEGEIKKLLAIAGEYIYGFEDDTLEKIVGNLLREKGATLSTAESCTGGYIAHRITRVPGSSDYYIGSIVAYANQIKLSFLDVSEDVLKNYGAVSEETVVAMAANINNKFKTDYAIAVSGIAGPDGGTPEKPVGTVWLAIAHPNGMFTKELLLGSVRERIIMETSLHALNHLRKILINHK